MRYEDLIADPEGQMRLLYERLQLGGFDAALPKIRKYLAEHAGYQTNRYPSLTPELRAEITSDGGRSSRGTVTPPAPRCISVPGRLS